MLSEVEQTLTILRTGIVGRDIHPDEEGCYLEGGVGYVVQYANDNGSPCSIGFEELDDHYEVVPSEIQTDTQALASRETMKAQRPALIQRASVKEKPIKSAQYANGPHIVRRSVK